jgi:hypothetical protein
MRKLQGMALLAIGAGVFSAAFCQAQSGSSPNMQMVGVTTADPVTKGNSDALKDKDAVTAIPVEDQATQEQVERLFQVMRVRQQTESLLKQMSTMMQQQISQGMKEGSNALAADKQPTPEQLAARQKVMAKLMDRAMHMYPVDEMLADMTPIYQRHISKSDIEAFIAFFGSSAGQHFLDQQPLIAKDYMPLVMSRVQEKSEALTQEMKKDLDALNSNENPGASTPAPR